MYLAMVLGMAEMSSALPAAGGGYTFARRALGPWGGFATGTAILIEYAIAPAAIATFIGAYVESLGLFGITDGWWVYLAVYAIFIGIHLSGVGEALKAMFVITAIALVGLVVFAIAAIGQFRRRQPHRHRRRPTAAGASSTSCRSATSASGRRSRSRSGSSSPSKACRWPPRKPTNPETNVPRGIIAAHGRPARHLRARCCSWPPGAGGAEAMSTSGNPLVEALGDGTAATVVNYIGLAGLVASFFSIMYAYSRQLFALSRAGYLPTALSVTNKPQGADLALIIPGIIGFALSLHR